MPKLTIKCIKSGQFDHIRRVEIRDSIEIRVEKDRG